MKRFLPILLVTQLCLNGFTQTIRKSSNKVSPEIKIEVSFPKALTPDSLQILIQEDNSIYSTTDRGNFEFKKKFTKDKDGNFRISLKLPQQSAYFSIVENDIKLNRPFMQEYFAELGDNIKIKIVGKDSISFSGQNVAKYIARRETDLKFYHDTTYIFSKRINEGLTILDKYKSSISRLAYDVLKADIVANNGNLLETFNRNLTDGWDGKTPINVNSEDFTGLITSPEVRLKSKFYSQYFLAKLKRELKVKQGNLSDISAYNYIESSVPPGNFRDKLIATMFLTSGTKMKNFDVLLSKALESVKNPEYYSKLSNMQSRTVGFKAYDFHLKNVEGNIVKLSDFLGKTVFIDFWYTGCGHCAEYYQWDLSKIEEHYKNDPNIVFLTVNIDLNQQEWIKSIKSGKYTSNDVINLWTGGLGNHHPIIKHYKIVGFPQPMVIDKNGKIASFDSHTLKEFSWAVSLIDKIAKVDRDKSAN